MQFVVAKYNEDYSWTGGLDNVIIYNKGCELAGSVVLPNIGREAHTYLYHIVTNYDILADHTCFLQGMPFDHCPDLSDRLANFSGGSVSYLSKNTLTCDRNGGPEHPGLEVGELYDKYFTGERTHFVFHPGAQFIVSKEMIRSRPKWFYEKLMCETSSGYPWIYERLWMYIFSEEPVRRLCTTQNISLQ